MHRSNIHPLDMPFNQTLPDTTVTKSRSKPGVGTRSRAKSCESSCSESDEDLIVTVIELPDPHPTVPDPLRPPDIQAPVRRQSSAQTPGLEPRSSLFPSYAYKSHAPCYLTLSHNSNPTLQKLQPHLFFINSSKLKYKYSIPASRINSQVTAVWCP